jgi:hypothetical protein
MKAQELRLGNLVAAEVNGEWNDCVGVYDLNEDELNGFKSYLRQAAGIPLTEEWLLKFGFIKGEYADFWSINVLRDDEDKSHLYLYAHLYKGEMYEFGLCSGEKEEFNHLENERAYVLKIEYVHQLQNLYFALTGEELTLKV